MMSRSNGHWESLIIELDNPNYAKVGEKMTKLEGNKVYVPGSTDKDRGYRYFKDMKFLPILKEFFDKSP
jgi:hypothetical protein